MRGGGRRSTEVRGRGRASNTYYTSDREREKNRMSPAARRSISVERRDYDAHRYLDRGKQLYRDNVEQVSRRQLALEKENYDMMPKYMLPDHISGMKFSSGSGDFNTIRSVSEQNVVHLGNSNAASALRIEMKSVLAQKSLLMGDGNAREYYTRVMDGNYDSDAAVIKSASVIGGSRSQLKVGIHDYKNQLNDPYNDCKGRVLYSEDMLNNPVVAPKSRPFTTVPSSSIAKDEFQSFYDGRIHQSVDTFERNHRSKLSDENLDKGSYQVQLQSPLTQDFHSENDRNDAHIYGYRNLVKKEKDRYRFHTADGGYRTMPWKSQDDRQSKIASSFVDNERVRISEIDSSKKSTYENFAWDQHNSSHGEETMSYRNIQGVHSDYFDSSGTQSLGLRMKPSRSHGHASQDEIYELEQVSSPMNYMRHQSPELSSHHVNMYERSITSPQGMRDFDILPSRHISMYERPINPPRRQSDFDDLYELSSNRMVRREYVMDDDTSEYDDRRISRFINYERMHSLSPVDELELKKQRVRGFASKSMGFMHNKYRKTSHKIPKFQTRFPAGDSPMHEEYDHPRNLKRRLKPGGPSDFHVSYPIERRKEYFRPKKIWKGDPEEAHGYSKTQYGNIPDEHMESKSDPPENSVEFKKQVHKFFLDYSKTLNETELERKKYLEQGQENSLHCCVCGSLSKNFSDAHCLVTHAYNSPKVGWRTKHLGLHKAICVLMGWNSLAIPTVKKDYQYLPTAEAKALRSDLILWPPFVIVHCSPNANKVNSSHRRVMTNKGMEELLKDMGFGATKPILCRGITADSGVFLLKFPATLSGLQEAERLHKNLDDKNHGKEEYLQISSRKNRTKVEEESGKKLEELLYGYMATAEDLPKLDDDTKKRCVIKSKKDIEAIADASLNAD